MLFLLAIASCGPSESPNENEAKTLFPQTVIQGEAQGTTWTVRYLNDSTDHSATMSSLLQGIDRDLSTYLEGSLINRVNAFDRLDTVFAFHDTTQYFSIMFEVSAEIARKTGWAFDPTVFPLVELWGFGKKRRGSVSDEEVAITLERVGMNPANIDLIEVYKDTYFYEETQIRKGRSGVMLDFNAIAQGFSVDLMAEVLDTLGIDNYMVELGGEVYCKGVNASGKPWRIAIDKPIDQAEREFQAVVELSNKAIATSGSYRKYYELDGKRYSHFIDPRNGYPVEHSMLSATVMAGNCAEADAYATAMMVMGLEASIAFLQNHPELRLDAFLIYDEDGRFETWMTPGFKDLYQDVSDL